MDLYLLSDTAQALSLCREAVEGCHLALHEASDADDLEFDSIDLDRSVLLMDSAYITACPDEVASVLRKCFLRTGVLVTDESHVEAVTDLVGEDCELLVNPTVCTLQSRLGDWSAIASLTQEGELQYQQLREIADVLETSTQDITALKQKITFLDRQRKKLSNVLETMNMLTKLSQEINCLDQHEIIAICVTKIPMLVNARYASLYMHNYEAGTLELKRHNHGYRIDETVKIDVER